eukprot:TRINITY_DN1426_c0_g1_i1.p2 TRINITY_DN1426_c0_g1~~TRINITY_DN1426_c0_g1_i1.p2  ORF type:complete len:142 (+),score=24.23 TRINITY_DN1426_c0_g1_i1:40-426(+)
MAEHSASTDPTLANALSTQLDAMEVDEPQIHSVDNLSSGNRRVLKFRCYNPHDDALKAKRLPPPPDLLRSVEKRFDELSIAPNEEALISIGPQNPNWDLKRDIQKKIEKLDALTSKALSDLLRDKLPS